ncbi:hypothetical protein FA13DRAFT_1712892 [Coprinellus micaceus]|uniref:Uncharacterized protein n=1 Tax=Coprinellus micaceus TaxID=71717 RepID=A0A4Y7SYG3_COPMI|nr:hypothetical protein FA13DRAFT_1712892 [Coprinellus micaceus]
MSCIANLLGYLHKEQNPIVRESCVKTFGSFPVKTVILPATTICYGSAERWEKSVEITEYIAELFRYFFSSHIAPVPGSTWGWTSPGWGQRQVSARWPLPIARILSLERIERKFVQLPRKSTPGPELRNTSHPGTFVPIKRPIKFISAGDSK